MIGLHAIVEAPKPRVHLLRATDEELQEWAGWVDGGGLFDEEAYEYEVYKAAAISSLLMDFD